MDQSQTDRPRRHLAYPKATMFELVAKVARQYPDEPAYEFYNQKTSYAQFIRRIERAARAFLTFGVGQGDAVTICLPNIPQALDCSRRPVSKNRTTADGVPGGTSDSPYPS